MRGFAVLLLVASVLIPFGSASAGLKTLYSFQKPPDGNVPESGVIEDKSGNLYGATADGGNTSRHGHTNVCRSGFANGCGTVFTLSRDGTEKVLYVFCQHSQNRKYCLDGGNPSGALVRDKSGNLFGTSTIGGSHGAGTVFEVMPDDSEKVIYSFCAEAGCSDGYYPDGGVISDSAGNLYGTTSSGGTCGLGYGTVFRLAPDGKETVLYSFCAGQDGEAPEAPLVMDTAGNLYGTTYAGGDGNGCSCGTVFKLAPDGTETILHAFSNSPDGAVPLTGLALDSSGNLYGTTVTGGAYSFCTGGCGTIFKIGPDGTEKILYSFCANGYPCADGADAGQLLLDSIGNLYGGAAEGGSGCGLFFKLAPDGTETVLYRFDGANGCSPWGSVLLKRGLFYGTTEFGGRLGYGTIFRLPQPPTD